MARTKHVAQNATGSGKKPRVMTMAKTAPHKPTAVGADAGALPTGVAARRRRWRSGTLMRRKQRRLQRSSRFLVSRAFVGYLLRGNASTSVTRATRTAEDLARGVVECLGLELFRVAGEMARVADTVTLQPRHLRFAMRMLDEHYAADFGVGLVGPMDMLPTQAAAAAAAAAATAEPMPTG